MEKELESRLCAAEAKIEELYQILASIGYTEYCHNRITTLRLARLEGNDVNN